MVGLGDLRWSVSVEGGKRIDTGAKSLVFAKNATVVILVMDLAQKTLR